jgi:hypothetical protein
MDRCGSCGAALPADATWCGQCFTATAPASSGVGGVVTTAPGLLTRPIPAPSALAAPVRRTRWRKTSTTFGPVGRVLATLGVLVPLAVMVVGGLADPFVWGGAAVWGVVVLPWALRDIWKAGQLAAV